MPLANDLRPESINEIIGQGHLLGEKMPIRLMVERDQIKSMILWGPAGIGKTTIARCMANDTACDFKELNATSSKIADIRKLISIAEARKKNGTFTIMFVDECHRWAKNVQDVLLPYVEDGTIILIGATTEKPQFAVNSPLLSRMQSFRLNQLSSKDMITALLKVVNHYKSNNVQFKIDKKAIKCLINKCGGDIRKLMTAMETIVEVLLDGDKVITTDLVDIAMPDYFFYFDKSGNEHYDYVQNIQCAIQCSDVNSAVYWLAMAFCSEEDPVYLARRILISSSEDCQDPFVSCIANNAYVAAKEIGYPECKIPMSHAVIAIANAKKDRTAINAISKAMNDIKDGYRPDPVSADSSTHVSNDGYTKVDRQYV